jgi:CRP-like cAMP-binding protein
VAGQILYEELDEIEEIIFITEGCVDIGYDLNKNRKFILRYDKKHVIGIFNCTFDARAMFVYMCRTICTGYFLRKKEWRKLLSEHQSIANVIKH